jgi:DNA-binding MarR family transcriptional regulator
MLNNTKTLQFENQVIRTWWLLAQARDVAFRARTRELGRYGITIEQSAVLFVIKFLKRRNLKITPGEISKRILREPDSVSKILSRMEKEGLLKKTSKLGNKRREVHIALTRKGEKSYKDSLNRNVINEIMSCLSEQDQAQLSSMLAKIIEKSLQLLTPKG